MSFIKGFSRTLSPSKAIILRHVPFLISSLQFESRSIQKSNTNMISVKSVSTSASDEEISISKNTDKDYYNLVKNLFVFKDSGSRNSLGNKNIKAFMEKYQMLNLSDRKELIIYLALDYAVDHDKIKDAALTTVDSIGSDPIRLARNEDLLRTSLTPGYSWLFKRIGQQEKGVKFLVDFRTDILDSLGQDMPTTTFAAIQRLNSVLRELLALWFSVGFLNLERVTWESPCAMLEKISEYEAVHPVRSWADIKRRVGPYRRCFVFTHSSMPGEPLVVLHTALCSNIVDSLSSIVSQRQRDATSSVVEDSEKIKSAIFYSISSTQKGLQGIDLGNYLIKRVAENLNAEFPSMTEYSTLSPIPGFRVWLLEKLKSCDKGNNDLLTTEEIKNIGKIFDNDVWVQLRTAIKMHSWPEKDELAIVLQKPLLRLCARYLFLEKRRGLALCSVANFHLSNGAVLWRINWMADMTVRGLNNSCGIMVNYRYYLEDTESNRKEYLTSQIIPAAEQIHSLSTEAKALYTNHSKL